MEDDGGFDDLGPGQLVCARPCTIKMTRLHFARLGPQNARVKFLRELPC